MSVRFNDIHPTLSDSTLAAVKSFGFTQMTPVQAATIPLFLSNKDVCVEATTGSGKTLAYGIPVLEVFLKWRKQANHSLSGSEDPEEFAYLQSQHLHDVCALIVAPTRELASQIHKVMEKLCLPVSSSNNGAADLERHVRPPVRCVLLSGGGGGGSVATQCREFLDFGGTVIIGTPGRIIDVFSRSQALQRGLKQCEMVVLDEADTLLDLGFRESLHKILQMVPKQRRTGLFSATQTKEVKELARAGLRNPVTVNVKVRADPHTNKTLLAGQRAAEMVATKDCRDGSEDRSDSKGSSSSGSEQDSNGDVSDLDDADPLDSPNGDAGAGAKDDSLIKPAKDLDLLGNSSLANIATPATLTNYFTVCSYDRRPDELVRFVKQHINEKIIVFCATCACVDYYSHVFHSMTQKVAERNGTAECEDGLIPSSIKVLGLHGKQVPKRRSAVYNSFVDLNEERDGTSNDVAKSANASNKRYRRRLERKQMQKERAAFTGGVLFCTDVAARGIDIPDVDWIVQLACPRDPAFFVHRVGRTARAGRDGGAVVFMTEQESAYVGILRGRGVPLVERPLFADVASTKNANDLAVLSHMKRIAIQDRAALEAGSTAFMAFLRSYKEHLCSFIFRLDTLDIGSVARGYALLKLPKIPETRGQLGAKILFEQTYIDTSKIGYKHTEKEKARRERLKAVKEEQARQEAEIEAAEREVELEEQRFEDASGSDADSDAAVDTSDMRSRSAASFRSLQSLKSIKSARTNLTTGTKQSARTKTQWIPEEQYREEELHLERNKRKRVKKESFKSKKLTEFEELQAEEAAYKKFKRGKITKEQYEQVCLLAEVAPDKESIEKLHVHNSYASSDDGTDGDSEAQNAPSKKVSFFEFPTEGPKRVAISDPSVKSFLSKGGTYKSSGSARSTSSKQSRAARKPMHDVLYSKMKHKSSKVGPKPGYRSGKVG